MRLGPRWEGGGFGVLWAERNPTRPAREEHVCRGRSDGARDVPMGRVERVDEHDVDVHAPRTGFARVRKIHQEPVPLRKGHVRERRNAGTRVPEHHEPLGEESGYVVSSASDFGGRHAPIPVAVETRHEPYAVRHRKSEAYRDSTTLRTVLPGGDAERVRVRFVALKQRDDKGVQKEGSSRTQVGQDAVSLTRNENASTTVRA